jgi:D-alanine-D-alanine ligase-like ATP-grasp enzyme
LDASVPAAPPTAPLWVDILTRACRARGARIEVEPLYGYAGAITAADGRRFIFKGTNFDINGAGASALAKDKDYASRFLAAASLPVPRSLLLHSPRRVAALALKNPAVAARLPQVEAAAAFAREIGWPVFVKPNEGSEGDGVTRVADEDALRRALDDLFAFHERVLVQQAVSGADHRVIVLDGVVHGVFRRSPLSITGDGRRSIAALAQAVLGGFSAGGKGARVMLADPRIAAHLAGRGLALASVPEPGVRIELLPNANLSTGGVAEDVTERVGAAVGDLAIRAARALGLRFAGVDLLLEGEDARDAWVLEVNSAPGLSYFHRLGEQEAARVEAIYEALLDAMLDK